MSFRGNLLRAGIDSDGKIVTIYRNDGRLDVLTAGSETSGYVRSANFTHTQGAAGAGIFETVKVSLASEYRTGSWANAIVGRIDYGDTGDSAGGMAAAICGEMNIAAKNMATLGGAYYCFDAEMNVPTGCTLMTSTTTRPVAFLKFGAWGGAVGQFDDKGYLFHVDGLTAGSGHLLSENSRTLRVNIEGTAKYLPLSAVEDTLDFGATDFTGGIQVGSRTSGSGIDLGTYEEGLLVAAQYEDAAAIANTTDYVGCAGIFDLHLNRDITLASGGGYGWATLWANLEIDKDINQTGASSAAWFSVWMDAGAASAIAGSSRIQGVDIALVAGSAQVYGASTKLYGLRIDSSVNNSATVSGEFAGINIGKSGSNKDWTIGIDINDASTGIDISADASTHGINAAADINIGSRTAGSGVDLGTWVSGILVGVDYYDAAAIANTTDYVGCAGIFNLSMGRETTLASGGGYGWAAVWANVELDEAFGSSGGMSAYWGTLWMDAASGHTEITGSCHIQVADFAIVTGADFDLGTGTSMFGIRIDSSINGSATLTGTCAAINIGKSGSSLDWPVGLDVNNCTTGIDVGSSTTGINFSGTYTNAIAVGSSATPSAVTPGNSSIRAFGDIQASVSTGGSVDNIYSHLYISPTVDVTSGAYAFAGHFRLEIQGGATTSITSMSAALRAYYMTDGTSSVSLDGTCATFYGECRLGNNTTVAATGNMAGLNLVSRVHASAVFDGEAQFWGIVLGRISASYQKFYAAMRITDCTYLIDTKDDDVMASVDEAATAGTKAGWLRIRFRESGVDRYIRLYDAGN